MAYKVIPPYLNVAQAAAQTTNVSVGDHFKFDTQPSTAQTFGGLITVNTTTSYTTTLGAASIGRFTLAANHTYYLLASLGALPVLTTPNSFTYQWFNVNTGQGVGVGVSAAPLGSLCYAVIATTVSTLVEVQITANTTLTSFNNGDAGSFNAAMIQVLQ